MTIAFATQAKTASSRSAIATQEAYLRAAWTIRHALGVLEDSRTTENTDDPPMSPVARANIKYLSNIIRQLINLKNETGADGYGELRITAHAFEVASGLLTDAAIVSARAYKGQQIPNGWASVDGEGGVRIDWTSPNAIVRLIIPASNNRKGYVYHEIGTSYATAPPTAESLAEWLQQIKD